MPYHVGPHGEASSLGQEAEAGVRGNPRPEPLLGFLWGKLGRVE